MKQKVIVIGLTCLLCMLLCIQFLGTPWVWQIWIAKQESMAYLEEKYGEPFTVGMPLFWIMDGKFHAEASPKAHPEIVFYVGTEQGVDGIQDNYDYARKQYVVEHNIQLLVAQAFPKKSVEVYMTTEFGLDGREEYDDVVQIILDEEAQKLHQISAKLYPVVSQLQALPVYEVMIFIKYKKLQLRHDTELKSEADFHALWRDME